MTCIRCGYCCTQLWAVVVRDPEREPTEDNLMEIGLQGEPERCPHLRGDRPGEYACAVHDKPWYPLTPCAQYQEFPHGHQCRMGPIWLEHAEGAFSCLERQGLAVPTLKEKEK